MSKKSDKAFIQALGKRIREIREGQGKSRFDIFSVSDIQVTQLARIERGETNPTVKTLLAIAEALGVVVVEFFKH